MLFSLLASYLVFLFGWLFKDDRRDVERPRALASNSLKFELRHLHATTAIDSARIIFTDVEPQKLVSSGVFVSDTSGSTKPIYNVETRRMTAHKPASVEAHTRARLRSRKFMETEALDWDEDVVIGPDVEKRETLLELAKMTNNAYVEPDDPAWYDIGRWNDVIFFWFLAFFSPIILIQNFSRTHLVGNRTQTASAAMSSQHRTIQPLLSPSRALRLVLSVEVDLLSKKTS
jgi:hypothetical protein